MSEASVPHSRSRDAERSSALGRWLQFLTLGWFPRHEERTSPSDEEDYWERLNPTRIPMGKPATLITGFWFSNDKLDDGDDCRAAEEESRLRRQRR